jgi:hypothetical protein
MVSFQVLPCPTLIFPSFEHVVFWNLFEISMAKKSLKNQYFPHFESKSYQIKSIKSLYQDISKQHQRHIPIPLKFLATIFI